MCERGEGPDLTSGPVCSNAELTECFYHRVGGLAAHAGEHVGVGVEGEGDGGVPAVLSGAMISMGRLLEKLAS